MGQQAEFISAAWVCPSGVGAADAAVFVGLRRKTAHVALVGSISRGPCEHTAGGAIW